MIDCTEKVGVDRTAIIETESCRLYAPQSSRFTGNTEIERDWGETQK